MAASEVDLPEPVPPTKMTKPRLVIAISFNTSGKPKSSNLGILVVIVLNTKPTEPRCTKAFTLKRATPGIPMAKLHSFVASNSVACLSFIIERPISRACWADSTCVLMGVIFPSIFIAGGKPAVINKSEAFLPIINLSKSNTNFSA